jgi:hypothetical protein
MAVFTKANNGAFSSTVIFLNILGDRNLADDLVVEARRRA